MSELDSMIIERDVAIPMDDGIVLRADIFRPRTLERVPVIMTLGPYGKGVKYRARKGDWQIPDGLVGQYMVTERVNPEQWVPVGYSVIHVDARGTGRSPGILDPLSPRENRDFYLAIEWAAKQVWSNGKVGLCGVSYYAINQWLVASLRPPHLAAMIPWEGAADHYREWSHHGGILSNVFVESWYSRVLSVQHGRGSRGPQDPWMGEPATGPETLSSIELISHRSNYLCNVKSHYLDDDFHRSRSADFSKISIPFLSTANWGGFALHQRGNFMAFTESASRQKWLEVHGGMHNEEFSLPHGVELQRRFFDYFLKGKKNGWDREQRVILNVRYVDHNEIRKENEWPLARTKWTKLYLENWNHRLSWRKPTRRGKIRFNSLGDGVTLTSDPFDRTTEITGPLAARLYVSSSVSDADLFLTVLALDHHNNEVDFPGASEPHAPLAQGWLRASHRALDLARSKFYQPYHPHNKTSPLKRHQIYKLDIEIWSTCFVFPTGYRMALTIQGKDFEREKGTVIEKGALGAEEQIVIRGSGRFLHNDPDDRPVSTFGGITEVYSGADKSSFVLVPIIPAIHHEAARSSNAGGKG